MAIPSHVARTGQRYCRRELRSNFDTLPKSSPPVAAPLPPLVPADPRLPRVRPRIRMGAMRIVVAEVSPNLLRQVFLRGEVPTPQHPPAQHAEPDLNLVQPAAMLGREVNHMPPAPRRQERPPLRPRPQPLLLTRVPAATLESQVAAQLQRPVRVQVVHYPVELLDLRELLHHIPDMPHEVPAPTPLGHAAEHLAGRHDQAADQAARAVPHVLELAPLDPTGLGRPRGVQSLQRL